MNLLSIEGVGKTFQDHPVFENISFGVNQGQKIALIAKNGTGKTTLLKIIAGDDTPDKGEVNQRKGTRISYLAQEPLLNPAFTIEECILQSNNESIQVIARYEEALNKPEEEEAYQQAFEAMDQYQAWDFETQYKQILSKLKLDQLEAKVGSLSGGNANALPWP